jgi:hypothetical protein
VFFSLHDGETISKEAKLNKPVSPIRNPFEKNQFDVFIDEVTNINSRILNLVLRTDGHRGKKKHILHPECVSMCPCVHVYPPPPPFCFFPVTASCFGCRSISASPTHFVYTARSPIDTDSHVGGSLRLSR